MQPINPIWRRHDWQRFIRHDAHRFLTPAGIEAEKRAAEAERAAQRKVAEIDAAEIEALRADHERVRFELAEVKFALALRRICRKYREDQPRVPAGNPDGGQWASGGGGGIAGQDDSDVSQDGEFLAQDRRSFLAPGPGQEPRQDLLELDAIAKDPAIRSRIDEAWAASNPNGLAREHGFWISRNAATGELSTRPFANPGGLATIVPGAPPSDAIAFFHTHPLRSEFGGAPGPSLPDQQFAGRIGLPGLLQSHHGMYYFGPSLSPRRLP